MLGKTLWAKSKSWKIIETGILTKGDAEPKRGTAKSWNHRADMSDVAMVRILPSGREKKPCDLEEIARGTN